MGIEAEKGSFEASSSAGAGLGFLGLGLSTASFIHMLSFPWWMGSLSGQILLVATLLLFFVPWSLWALVVFLVSSLVYWFQRLPLVPNHIFFEMLIHFSLLGAVLIVLAPAWRKGGLKSPTLRGVVYEQMRLVVMSSLVILYLFTVLHKLNWDFFDPTASCAVSMHRELANAVPLVPAGEWTHWPAIIGTLVIELAIPLCLIFRKTRALAVAIGLVFHWFLALHPHGGIYSFSHLLFALYGVFLFSSTEDPCQLWRKIPRPLMIVLKLAAIALFGTAIMLQMGAYRLGGGFQLANTIGFYAWLPFAAWLVVTYIPSLAKHLRFKGTPAAVRLNPVLLVFPVLVFLNGFCPYLGLKTTTVFSMFSNLRTEGDGNNHLFMPRFKLFGFQDDLVEILETNDPQLNQYAGEKDVITWFEFRRIVSSRKRADLFVRYQRDGVERTVNGRDGLSGNQNAFTPHPWYANRFLVFRPIGRFDRPMPCRH